MVVVLRGQELKRSGFIGIQAGEISGGGVRVLSLVGGGSAEAAGIKVGDVITQLDERVVVNTEDFVATVSQLRAGDSVSIRLTRSGEIRTTRLAVKARPLESSVDAGTM